MCAAQPEPPPPDHPSDPVDNRERRTLCVFVVDTSTAMTPAALDEIRADLEHVRRSLCNDPLLLVRVELAVVTGEEATAARPLVGLVPPDSLPTVSLSPGRGAIEQALPVAGNLLEERRRQCQRLGIDVGSSWLWVLCAQDPPGDAVAEWTARADRLRAEHDLHVVWLRRSGSWRLWNRLAGSLGTSLSNWSWRSSTHDGRHSPPLGAARLVYLRARDDSVRLQQVVHRGRSAQLYAVSDDPSVVAKIYHDPQAVSWTRIEHLLATPWNPAADGGWRIASPLDIVLDDAAARIGFLMRRVDGLQMPQLYNRCLRRSTGSDLADHHRALFT